MSLKGDKMAGIDTKINWQDQKFKQRVFMPNSLTQCPMCGSYIIPRNLKWVGSSQDTKLGLFREHYLCSCVGCKKQFKLDEVRKVFHNKPVAQLLYVATDFNYSESHTI